MVNDKTIKKIYQELMKTVGVDEAFSDEQYECYMCPHIVYLETSPKEMSLLISCGGETSNGILYICEACLKKIYKK